jgi:hypothetical protein
MTIFSAKVGNYPASNICVKSMDFETEVGGGSIRTTDGQHGFNKKQSIGEHEEAIIILKDRYTHHSVIHGAIWRLEACLFCNTKHKVTHITTLLNRASRLIPKGPATTSQSRAQY